LTLSVRYASNVHLAVSFEDIASAVGPREPKTRVRGLNPAADLHTEAEALSTWQGYSGNRDSPPKTASDRLVYVQNPQRIDEIFAATVTVNGTPTKVFPMTDALGSVYGLGDQSGALASSFSFDVYGARTQTSGTTALRFGFTGREHEADSGLGYNRNRFLSFATGAWTQPDRLGFGGGDTNLFAYVKDRPTAITDPSGLRVVPCEDNTACFLRNLGAIPVIIGLVATVAAIPSQALASAFAGSSEAALAELAATAALAVDVLLVLAVFVFAFAIGIAINCAIGTDTFPGIAAPPPCCNKP
jgi:RHS repeat-associated protein